MKMRDLVGKASTLSIASAAVNREETFLRRILRGYTAQEGVNYLK